MLLDFLLSASIFAKADFPLNQLFFEAPCTVDVKISYSLLYFECTFTGTDGNYTGTEDTDMMVLALVLKVLTALALMLMTLAQSYLIFTDRF